MKWSARGFVPLFALLLVASLGAFVAGSPSSIDGERMSPVSRQPISIMPIGDSITGSTGCWRAGLWTKLRGSGHGAIDFTGRGNGPECDYVYDDDAVAYSGTRVVTTALGNKFFDVLNTEADSAGITLMHLGSNDIRDDESVDAILDGYSTVVELLRKANPHMVVLVAQLIPITTTPMGQSCPHCPDKVRELNEAIPAWAQSMDTKRSPVKVVNQYDGFDTEDDSYDGLHPDDSGCEKMADKWFDAIDTVLDRR